MVADAFLRVGLGVAAVLVAVLPYFQIVQSYRVYKLLERIEANTRRGGRTRGRLR